MTEALTGPSTGPSTVAATTSTTGVQGNNSLGKDAFLQLLVAQLRFQDPGKPTDATQFLSQTAQFTLVEKFEDLTATNQALLATVRSQSAAGLVGREVSWLDGQVTKSGTVTAVTVANGEPVLQVGDTEVRLDAVTKVSIPTPEPAA